MQYGVERRDHQQDQQRYSHQPEGDGGNEWYQDLRLEARLEQQRHDARDRRNGRQ